MTTPWQVYVVAIFLGLVGISVAYLMAKAVRLHPMNARTVGWRRGSRTGRWPSASCCSPSRGHPMMDQILLIPVLYSLFIVIVATFVTFYFRRANLAEEQKIPSLLGGRDGIRLGVHREEYEIHEAVRPALPGEEVLVPENSPLYSMAA
jgi:hypothetical protein